MFLSAEALLTFCLDLNRDDAAVIRRERRLFVVLALLLLATIAAIIPLGLYLRGLDEDRGLTTALLSLLLFTCAGLYLVLTSERWKLTAPLADWHKKGPLLEELVEKHGPTILVCSPSRTLRRVDYVYARAVAAELKLAKDKQLHADMDKQACARLQEKLKS